MKNDLAKRIFDKLPKNGKYYLVAIDGRGGSGKTTLADYVTKLLPDFLLINGDDYFEPDDSTIAWGSFNEERFFSDVIKPLREQATTLKYKPYDWHSVPHITEKVLQIKKGVVMERSGSFAFDLDWDFKIWVETPKDIAGERGLIRDAMPREQSIRQWEEVWQPKEDAHFNKVKPLETADIVIDGTEPFEEQL